jgi:hypothetical protein
MSQLTFPESLLAVAEQRSVAEGFGNVVEYIADLVRRDLKQSGDLFDDLVDAKHPQEGSNETERAQARKVFQERIVDLLDEAIASGPATPMTSKDWQDFRDPRLAP